MIFDYYNTVVLWQRLVKEKEYCTYMDCAIIYKIEKRQYLLNLGLIKMGPTKHESNVSYSLTVYAFFRGLVINST